MTLVVRTNPRDNRQFYGCSGFRNGCRYTQSINGNGSVNGNGSGNGKVRVHTPEQKTIIEVFRSGLKHILVNAGPGCAKSSTALDSSGIVKTEFPEARVVYTCFSKTIATDFARIAPAGVKVSTMHSLGNGIITKAFPNSKMIMGKHEKTNMIIDGMADDDKSLRAILNDEKREPFYRDAIGSLVSHCKNQLINGTDVSQLEQLCERFGIDSQKGEVFQYVPIALERSKLFYNVETLYYDFDDMTWLPIVLDLNFGKVDAAIIDECQDLNPARQHFAFRLAGDGVLMLIGDRNQSIFGFTGADCDGMTTLESMLREQSRELAVLSLSTTFRCPKSHVRWLNEHFPNNKLNAFEHANEGLIETIGTDQIIDKILPGDLILCRVNAPLVSWFFKLLKAKKRAIVIGRKDEVTTLISAIKALKGKSIPDLLTKIEKAKAKELKRIEATAKGGKKPSLHLIEACNDKFEILREITSSCKGIGDIEPTIRSMFGESTGKDDDRIRLSSVHRSKGTESNGVFILHPEMMPHPKAETPEELQQEDNIRWVAYSRSKDRLFIVNG
jgi:superfamily I DNA/RNA helicase